VRSEEREARSKDLAIRILTKSHEVAEINKIIEVVSKSRLQPRNEFREKPKKGYEVNDKVEQGTRSKE
jgi:hypothetical protein